MTSIDRESLVFQEPGQFFGLPLPAPLQGKENIGCWKQQTLQLLDIIRLVDYVEKSERQLAKTEEEKRIVFRMILSTLSPEMEQRLVDAGWNFRKTDADPKELWDLIDRTCRRG